jgi:hypothetical protein
LGSEAASRAAVAPARVVVPPMTANAHVRCLLRACEAENALKCQWAGVGQEGS